MDAYKTKFYFSIVLFFIAGIQAFAKTVSPKDFGFYVAKTGEERYMALYNTHVYANAHNLKVNYEGLGEIHLSIPRDANPMPLGQKTDFKGTVFVVYNNVKDNFPLFEVKNTLTPCNVRVDNGKIRLTSNHDGKIVLILTDKEPWVTERQGFGYKATRKDALLFTRGNTKTATISPYTAQSIVEAEYFKTNSKRKYVQNAHFIRDPHSTQKTLFLNVENTYNLTISSIKVSTPKNDVLYGDAIFTIRNSVKVILNNIQIDNTYSQTEKYGYAFVLNNVTSFEAEDIMANGDWGVFCCNNLNTAIVKNSVINRFDIHCYGKDFTFEKCRFTKTGIPMSSFFGQAVFNNCVFDKAISIIYRTDYNAYTPFDVIYKACTFILDNKRNYIIDLVSVPLKPNERPELQIRNLPNIDLKNCAFILEQDVKSIELVKGCPQKDKVKFEHISSIKLSGIKMNREDIQLFFFDNPVETGNKISLSIEKSFFQSCTHPSNDM